MQTLTGQRFAIRSGDKVVWDEPTKSVQIMKKDGETVVIPPEPRNGHRNKPGLFINDESDFSAFVLLLGTLFGVGFEKEHQLVAPTYIFT